MKTLITIALYGFSAFAFAQDSASLKFSSGTARTGEEVFYDNYLVTKETPKAGKFCIEEIRGLRKLNKTLSNRISRLSYEEARSFDLKRYNWTTEKDTCYVLHRPSLALCRHGFSSPAP